MAPFARAFEGGIVPGTAVAFHATTVEAIEKGFRTGKLPLDPNRARHSFLIFPRFEHWMVKERVGREFELSPGVFAGGLDSFTAAKKHAAQIAPTSLLVKLLRLPDDEISYRKSRELLSRPETTSPDLFFAEHLVSRRRLDGAQVVAKQTATGVVIALGEAFLLRHALRNTDGDEPGLFANVEAQGLDLSFIEGIEPGGDYEYDTLDRLISAP